MRRTRTALVATAMVASLGLAACGSSGSGSGSGSGGASTGSAASAPSRTLPRVVVESAASNFNAQRIYAKASPGVVTISSIFSKSSPTSLFGGGASAAQGSGFVIDSNGEIATNAHVVTDAEAGGTASGTIHEAKKVFVQFPDRNQVPAKIIGFDPDADVALLRIDPAGLHLHPLRLATNEKVAVGQPVAAIGSPFGEDNSLSVGIVSATDRAIDSLTNFKIEGAIQTDASINPGNSGGPLLDARGDVIGIDQQINTTSGGNEGVGFAVPVGLVSHSLDQLRKDGHASYAYLGVRTEQLYPQLADKLGLPTANGAMITRVIPGGPADSAGLRAADQTVHFQAAEFKSGGDVIIAVNGDPVTRASDLPILVSRLDPGQTATLTIIRDGHRMKVDVKLGTRPESSGG